MMKPTLADFSDSCSQAHMSSLSLTLLLVFFGALYGCASSSNRSSFPDCLENSELEFLNKKCSEYYQKEMKKLFYGEHPTKDTVKNFHRNVCLSTKSNSDFTNRATKSLQSEFDRIYTWDSTEGFSTWMIDSMHKNLSPSNFNLLRSSGSKAEWTEIVIADSEKSYARTISAKGVKPQITLSQGWISSICNMNQYKEIYIKWDSAVQDLISDTRIVGDNIEDRYFQYAVTMGTIGVVIEKAKFAQYQAAFQVFVAANFVLLHEYAHIMLDSNDNQGIESFFNIDFTLTESLVELADSLGIKLSQPINETTSECMRKLAAEIRADMYAAIALTFYLDTKSALTNMPLPEDSEARLLSSRDILVTSTLPGHSLFMSTLNDKNTSEGTCPRYLPSQERTDLLNELYLKLHREIPGENPWSILIH
jgi:hypothetical protein